MKKDDLQDLIDTGVIQKKPDLQLLKSELIKLAGDGFLQRLPNEFFAFSNNLTWEVIYDTLLFAERRHLHSLVAEHVELFNKNNLESVADLLLHHYTEANNWEKCIYFASISGDRAAKMYANDDAINSYNRIFKALEQLPGEHIEDKCLVNERIGDVYLSGGQDKDASDALLKALEYWRKSERISKQKYVPWPVNIQTQESILCRKIAMAYQGGMAKYDESLEWLDDAISKLPKRPGRIASQIYVSKSATYYRKGQLQESIEWGRKALQIAKRLKNNQDIAYAYYMLANSYMWGGKFHQAITQLNHASIFYEQMDDLVGQGKTYNNIGTSNHLLGNLKEANLNYTKAIAMFKRIHHESGVALLNNNIGEILLTRGKIQDAIDSFGLTVVAFESKKCEKPLAGLALVNLCRCHRANNDLITAEETIKRGTTLLKEVGSDVLIAESELDLIELKLDQKKLKDAIKQGQKSLEKIKQLNVAPLLVRAERVLGNAWVANNEIKKAKLHLQESINLAKKLNAEHEEAKSIIALTTVCIRSNTQDKKINKLLKHAITILENMGAELDLAQAKDLQENLGYNN